MRVNPCIGAKWRWSNAREEGTGEGEVSGGGCGLFSSALRHIGHLRAANSEATEPGYRRTSRRKHEDSTGDRRCKGERTVAGVGSFQRVVRFRQMTWSLGFIELVDFGGQDEIALRQAVDLVRPGRDLDFSPGKE